MIDKNQWHLNVSLNGHDSHSATYDVCEMFACSWDGDLYLGCINPKYLHGFIDAMSEFAATNNRTIDYLTKTYYL